MHHIQNYKGSNSAKAFARIKMHNSKHEKHSHANVMRKHNVKKRGFRKEGK